MKKSLIILAALSTGLITSSFAVTPEVIVEANGILPYAKAKKQWIRVFKKDRKMKRLGLAKYSESEKEALLKYLIQHAADSDNPTVPGM